MIRWHNRKKIFLMGEYFVFLVNKKFFLMCEFFFLVNEVDDHDRRCLEECFSLILFHVLFISL